MVICIRGDFVEIKYLNTIEDFEFLLRFIQYKHGCTKYKYFICSISFISGIYYSIKLENLIYFFTNTVIMTFIVFLWLKKTENKIVERIAKKQAIKNCKKDKYYLSEKKLVIDSKSIFIYWDENNFEIELDIFVKLYVVDNYILILPMTSAEYKKQLIIPINAFKDEEEVNRFIEKIRDLTMRKKLKDLLKK